MRTEKIGDATLYLGDCLGIIPTLDKVDAVVTDSHAVVTDGIMGHEKSTGRKSETGFGISEDVGEAGTRNAEALRGGGVVTTAPSGQLRGNAGRHSEGNEATRYSIEGQGQGGETERALCPRQGEYAVSEDGQQKDLQQMRGNRSTANPPQERQSSGQRNIKSGGALLPMPHKPPQAGMVGQKTWAIITDPPYGIGAGTGIGKITKEGSDFTGANQWDDAPPPKEVFDMLLAFCDEHIIWGGNYFNLPPSAGFYIWDKIQPEKFTLAMAEMAWTSIKTPAKIFRKKSMSINNGFPKEHPTQKPL